MLRRIITLAVTPRLIYAQIQAANPSVDREKTSQVRHDRVLPNISSVRK